MQRAKKWETLASYDGWRPNFSLTSKGKSCEALGDQAMADPCTWNHCMKKNQPF